MDEKDHVRIGHILETGEDLASFILDKKQADLDSDKMLFYAVTRAIEIIGEAAAKVTDKTRSEFPTIPWIKASDLRNRLAHAYFNINSEIIWETATRSIPELLAEFQRLGLEKPKS